MFCMLLRKWIGNAKLIAIRQPGMERVLLFDFETTNDFGDTVVVTLAAEIMGRYSNLILIGPDGRIVDSVRRVGADRSSLRQILPAFSMKIRPPRTGLISSNRVPEQFANGFFPHREILTLQNCCRKRWRVLHRSSAVNWFIAPFSVKVC